MEKQILKEESIEQQIQNKEKRLKEVNDRLNLIEHHRDALLVARSYRRDAGEEVETGEPDFANNEYNSLVHEESVLLADINSLKKLLTVKGVKEEIEKTLILFESYQQSYQDLCNEDDSNLDYFGKADYEGREELLNKMKEIAEKIRELKEKLTSLSVQEQNLTQPQIQEAQKQG